MIDLIKKDPRLFIEQLKKALAPAKERLRKERPSYKVFSEEYKKHPERFNKPKAKGSDSFI